MRPVSSENCSSICPTIIALASVTCPYNCSLKPLVFTLHEIYLLVGDKASLSLDTMPFCLICRYISLSLTSCMSTATGLPVVMLLPCNILAGDGFITYRGCSQICNGKLKGFSELQCFIHQPLHGLDLSLNKAIG